VPADGIMTCRLVAPGAMSPVSTVPSFRRTRCTTESVFLNTTIAPPADAGFGENEFEPFSPVIVIVIAVGDGGVLGAVGTVGVDES
jgi:hypothetical protein